MAKKEKQRFVLNLKLRTEKYQEDILSKRFEIGRLIYNAVLGRALNRYREMIKTKRWRENQLELSNLYKTFKNDLKQLKNTSKPYYTIKAEMLKEFRLNEYSLHADVKPFYKKYKNNIDSNTCQKIATRVWSSLNDNIFGEGEEIRFKGRNNPLKSLEGKWNKAGLKYNLESNLFIWNKLKIPTELDIYNEYEINCLRNKICYCRLKRKFVRGKYKYILQIVLEGVPPIKVNNNTGEVKNDIGLGTVGIDIGTQTVAFVSDYDCKLYELAPRVQNIENEKRKIQRYMDRSKRATNPNNFNTDGTFKRGVKLKWSNSKKYIKAKNRLNDLYRKQADLRKQDHNIIANKVLINGNIFKVEKMDFLRLQMRVKNTTINEQTGKFNKKKRFGKSLENKAPSKFLVILQNKVEARNGLYSEINTREVKASQYNHLNKLYNKKKLSQRWNYFEYNNKQIKVQRDLYSAFLIKNVDDLKTINNETCSKDFDNFLSFHDREIERLQGKKNLSSMGI